MSIALNEIRGQSEALRALARACLDDGGGAAFDALPAAQPLLLTGMGASYHAACNAALHMTRCGVAATAMQASDLLHYGAALLGNIPALVYISQSGESAEVAPILAALNANCRLVGVTNGSESTLARRAGVALPLHGGVETTIAGKTYVNSLALLWLLARRRCNGWDGTEQAQIEQVAVRAAELLDPAASVAGRWLDALGTTGQVLFLGHGPHAVTARHAAMTLAEVAKVLPWHSSVGAFRHGLIEAARAELPVVIFAGHGPGYASSLRLAGELEAYGVNVWLVENGQLRPASQPAAPDATVDEFLAPVLNVIPAQLYALALAEARGVREGFRFISKVVSQL